MPFTEAVLELVDVVEQSAAAIAAKFVRYTGVMLTPEQIARASAFSRE